MVPWELLEELIILLNEDVLFLSVFGDLARLLKERLGAGQRKVRVNLGFNVVRESRCEDGLCRNFYC